MLMILVYLYVRARHNSWETKMGATLYFYINCRWGISPHQKFYTNRSSMLVKAYKRSIKEYSKNLYRLIFLLNTLTSSHTVYLLPLFIFKKILPPINEQIFVF